MNASPRMRHPWIFHAHRRQIIQTLFEKRACDKKRNGQRATISVVCCKMFYVFLYSFRSFFSAVSFSDSRELFSYYYYFFYDFPWFVILCPIGNSISWVLFVSSCTTGFVSPTCLARAPKKCRQSGTYQFDINSLFQNILSTRKLKHAIKRM